MTTSNIPDESSNLEQKSLVYLSRLTNAERQQLFRADDAFQSFKLRSQWHNLIQTLSGDRIIRAESCLEAAEFLVSLSDPLQAELRPEFLRTAVNKAYYSIHHSIRAIALLENEWEADGHEQAISELKSFVKTEKFRIRSGPAEGIGAELARARDNRSVADYSPYAFSRKETKTKENMPLAQLPASDVSRRDTKVDWVHITEDSWEKAAKFNIDLAQRLLKAADKIWKGK